MVSSTHIDIFICRIITRYIADFYNEGSRNISQLLNMFKWAISEQHFFLVFMKKLGTYILSHLLFEGSLQLHHRPYELVYNNSQGTCNSPVDIGSHL